MSESLSLLTRTRIRYQSQIWPVLVTNFPSLMKPKERVAHSISDDACLANRETRGPQESGLIVEGLKR